MWESWIWPTDFKFSPLCDTGILLLASFVTETVRKLEVKLFHQTGFVFVIIHHNSAAVCGGINPLTFPISLLGSVALLPLQRHRVSSHFCLSPIPRGRVQLRPLHPLLMQCFISVMSVVIHGLALSLMANTALLIVSEVNLLIAAHPLHSSPWALKALLTVPSGWLVPCMNISMFVTQLPQWLWCWDSECCLQGLALWRREHGITVVAHQTTMLGIQEFEMLWCFRGAGIGISSDSGQGGGGWDMYPWPLYFIPRKHSMNDHKRQLQLSSSGHTALRLSMLGSREKCGGCLTALSFPPARAGGAPSAEQLCLSSGTWHWQWSGAVCPVSLPCSQQERKRGGFCPPGVAKVGDCCGAFLIRAPRWKLRQGAEGCASRD